MTLALLDGDIIAYRSAAGTQRSIDWGDGVTTTQSTPEAAIENAVNTVQEWSNAAGASRFVIAFTGPHNWRKQILPSYKANRTAPKPAAHAAVLAELRSLYETITIDGLEADDVLGILMTTPAYKGAVCVSVDKDMRTIPGKHLNPYKERFPYLVSPTEADFKWLMQTLHGDTTDGYTGIPGIGPKKAEKILGNIGAPALGYWPLVVAAYVTAGLTEADALTQARVARILRREDYDKETKEVLLWSPRSPVRLALAASVGETSHDTAPTTKESRP